MNQLENDFQYIVETAKKLSPLVKDDYELLNALNKLDKNTLETIKKRYKPNAENQPVNKLRIAIASSILENNKVDKKLIEEIKESIRKDATVVERIEEKKKSRDIFASWNKLWAILYVFFYSPKDIREIKDKLYKIADHFIDKLELVDYEWHFVDFQGSQNFGSENCWIALFPKIKQGHKNSIQLFVEIGKQSKAGVCIGDNLENKGEQEYTDVNTIEEVLNIFKKEKTFVVDENNKLPNYFYCRMEKDVWEKSITNCKINLQNWDLTKEKDELGFLAIKNVKLNDVVFIVNFSEKKICMGTIKKINFNAMETEQIESLTMIWGKDIKVENKKSIAGSGIFRPAKKYIDLLKLMNNEGESNQATDDNEDGDEIVGDVQIDGEEREINGKDIKDDLFLDEIEIENIKENLKRKKNIILQGAPGVGKTFVAKKIAQLFCLKDAENSKSSYSFKDHIKIIQFHQSYSYEDFIQGFRPNDKGNFEIKNGVFYDFCQAAINNKAEKYLFIIDEINRGNLSKIFGELMLLIEADKRNEEYAVNLTYTDKKLEKFYIPENMYIIGTMNTADRSLSIVDYALRRRFAFVTLKPMFEDKFMNHLNKEWDVDYEVIKKLTDTIAKLNKLIEDSLGEGFLIGHSYFCTKNAGMKYKSWIKAIVRYDIIPLLEEYWFDDSENLKKAKELLSEWIVE